MKMILGSQSISRQALIKQLGYDAELMSADIDEKAIRSDDLMELPLLLAHAKADALLPKINEPALLITADQVIVWNGELREKPESEEQARQYLKSYAVHPAQTNTAIVVTNTDTGQRYSGVDAARAYFNPVPDSVINQLLGEGNIMSASGGFRIEDPLLEPYVNHLEGTKDSIMGLPLKLTKQLIDQAMAAT